MKEKFYNMVEAVEYMKISRPTLTKIIQRYQFADWAKGTLFIIGEKNGIRYAISKTFLSKLKEKLKKKEIKPILSLENRFLLISLDSLIEFSNKNNIKTVEQLKKKIEQDKKQVKDYLY